MRCNHPNICSWPNKISKQKRTPHIMSVREDIYCVICNKKKQNERRRLWCYKKQIRDKACWDAFEPTQTHSCWQDDERISSLVILSLLFCVWSRARGVKQIMGPFACHHRHHHNGFIVVGHLCVNKRFEEAWNVIFKGGGGVQLRWNLVFFGL